MLEGACAWASVFAGVVAAALWFGSTRVRVTKRAADIRPEEFGIWLYTTEADLREQPYLTAQRQNRWNAWAAGATAVVVLLQAASLIAHRFGW